MPIVPRSTDNASSTKLNLIPSFLYTNTKFSLLRTIKDLESYEPRYNPTVVKLPPLDAEDAQHSDEKHYRVPSIQEIADQQAASPNHYHSSSFYTSQYQTLSLTPTKVIEGLLAQISSREEHGTAFLQIIPEKVIAAAEASTTRYRNRKPLSPLDGVPVAVKDELDLDGYEKSLGSLLDFTRKEGGTSWCIQKLEDAGAIIVGKTSMHELGLGT